VLLGAVDDDIAIAETIAATLPAKARGRIFLEVADASGIRAFAAPGRVCVTWLCRDRGQSMRAAVDAWLAEMLPIEAEREHQVYAWTSGDRAAHALTSD
jgi:NADPH-dependent ferric siderophore reductase